MSNRRKRERATERALLGTLAVCLGFLVPLSAAADEFDQFAIAKNAFEAGEYEVAVTRFEELLSAEPKNPALVLETHKLLGVSYLFVGNRHEAEANFLKLLTLSPEYSLDPMVFPIDVVDFFTEIKQKNDERLAEFARARAAEEAARRKAEEEARRKELEKLARTFYLERSREEKSLLVALMPLGAGQFQNGEKLKGALFLGGELLLGATAVTTYFLHEGLRPRSKEPFTSTSDREAYERLEAGYRITNHASLVALAVVATVGIIDSLYNFERETIIWKEVEEGDVPDDVKPTLSKAALVPFATENAIGLSATASF
jgi:tetratricopeptide (TPR) repeat protein